MLAPPALAPGECPMSNFSRRSLLLVGCAVGTSCVLSKTAAAENASQRVALSGYDPVSYFTAARPEKGLPEFAAPFDDATYWFKSAEHRAIRCRPGPLRTPIQRFLRGDGRTRIKARSGPRGLGDPGRQALRVRRQTRTSDF